jgi:type IV secretion system protein VirB8
MNNRMLEEHFAQGKTWEQDRYNNLTQSNRLAWMIAASASFLALCFGVALSIVSAKQEVIPYIMTVDKQSGYMEMAHTLKDAPISTKEAMTDWYLGRYVTMRESYHNALVEERAWTVREMSEGTAEASHREIWDTATPKNPSTYYGSKGKVEIEILAITALNNKTASIRFRRMEDFQGRKTEGIYTAILVYRYVPQKLKTKDRMRNPLGFKVSDYNVTEEFTK